MKHGREVFFKVVHNASCAQKSARRTLLLCSRGGGHPTGITCLWILFIRSVHDVFSIARAQVGTRTKRDVETCLAGSLDVERDLGTHRTNVLAARYPLELSRVPGNFFVNPGIIKIIANHVAIS